MKPTLRTFSAGVVVLFALLAGHPAYASCVDQGCPPTGAISGLTWNASSKTYSLTGTVSVANRTSASIAVGKGACSISPLTGNPTCTLLTSWQVFTPGTFNLTLPATFQPAGTQLSVVGSANGSYAVLGGTVVFPGPPAPTVTTLYPTYFVGAVYYTPPGIGSYVQYGSGTSVGSSVSASTTFKTSASVKVSLPSCIGKGNVSFGGMYGTTTTTSVDTNVNTSSQFKIGGPGFDAVNHDYDEILVYLGVKIVVTQDYLGNVTWALDFQNSSPSSGVPVLVGWLRGTVPWDSNVLAQLNASGVTAADYPKILGADPFADPTYKYIDPNRFYAVSSYEYAYYPQNQNSYTYTVSNSYSSSYTQTVTYQVDAGVNLNPFASKVSWQYSSSYKLTSGNTGTSTLGLSEPSPSYTGPTTLVVYVDTLWKTFMFVLQ